MMERISENSNISVEEATQSVMEALGGIPVGRPTQPDVIAEMDGFFVSPRAAYWAGTEYIIDGETIPTI
ncbi:hypothetical protein [Cesiribacter sp. SM1]|uniref:hypothetical protein n=1 Tax=Cesiribacter sp. SM1 TaxID=2861196 RepID=UPI001CD7C721|nr:hypothetical protein [Cesiribacter sp. SM1]